MLEISTLQIADSVDPRVGASRAHFLACSRLFVRKPRAFARLNPMYGGAPRSSVHRIQSAYCDSFASNGGLLGELWVSQCTSLNLQGRTHCASFKLGITLCTIVDLWLFLESSNLEWSCDLF